MTATTKLWGGRFTGATDPLMTSFNESLPYDRTLHTADILGSKAYARAIHKSSILTVHELSELLRGLDLVEQEWLDNKFVARENDEDIHTANERRLGELIGREIAGKLHTGRSRNDQVATDMRIWVRMEGGKLMGILKELVGVMVSRAEKEIEVLMPGYTHLQRAQPIRWGHLLCGYATFLSQDLQRLKQLLERVNLLPLGSGALAGNPFNVDREFLAKELGFDGIIENSLVAVSDRDFVTEFLFWASLTSQHLSRLAEDLIIYGTAEFGFVQLADAYSYPSRLPLTDIRTGSSLMPQKKNSDSLELLRGKSGRLFGHLAGFMMTVKGLPSTYNKDLQESQEPLFDTMSQISACLQITTGVISTLTIHPEAMRKSLGAEMLATDLADYLVRKGVPFRDTHHISGQAVALAEKKKCGINELSVEDFRGLSPVFEEDVMKVFDFEASVEARSARGGTAKKSVLDQIARMKELLKSY